MVWWWHLRLRLLSRLSIWKNELPNSKQIRYHINYLPEKRDKLRQLPSRHEAKQFGPRFQRKFTEFSKIRVYFNYYIHACTILGKIQKNNLCSIFFETIYFFNWTKNICLLISGWTKFFLLFVNLKAQ
jgi:hypothetical protein